MVDFAFQEMGKKKKKKGGTRELFSGKGMSCACTYFSIGEAKRDDDYGIARCFYVPCEEQRKVGYSRSSGSGENLFISLNPLA